MSEEFPAKSVSELRWTRYYARKLQRHPAFAAIKTPLHVARSAVSDSFRLATQRFRYLPTAIIAGAIKAGTTQLHSYLIRHPRCLAGAEKEVRYFTANADRPLEWYRSRFPLRLGTHRQPHVIDATPAYMSNPQALRHMQSVLPDARVIVILRDPAARAFSHYQHAKTRHREPRRFEEAVLADLEQSQCPPRLGVALDPDAPPMKTYVTRGYYGLQIELLLALYPRERVLILDSADLFTDTNATCQRVFEFLGLDSWDVHPDKIYNRGYYRETIDPALAERLREHYRPYDELLVDVVGRRFSWMSGDATSRLPAASAA